MHTVKESSDTLNPAIVETAHIVVPSRRRTIADYVALAIATFGVGLIPLAPGTWGAGVGVVIYLFLGRVVELALTGNQFATATQSAGRPFQQTLTALLLIVIVIVSLAGTWAATRAERLLGKKDPGAVVADEVAGQLITFLFVPWGAPAWMIATGFIAFRVFDIWKPYPIDRLEGLEFGLGVMADDVLAGAYSATLMAIVSAAYLMI